MAHSFDAKTLIVASTSNPVTGTHTCGAAATLLVVTLAYANGSRTGAPTYNGVELLQADRPRYANSAPEARAELWYLILPGTGSAYTISVPNPNALSLEVVASSYSAATGYVSRLDFAVGNQNNGSGNPATSIKTGLDGSVIVGVIADGLDAWAPSGRSGTQLYDNDNGSWGAGHQYYLQSTRGAQSISWTANNDDWGMVVASFVEIVKGIHVSKAGGVTILAQQKGIVVPKAGGVTILAQQKGIVVPKAGGVTVLAQQKGITVVKASVLTILGPCEYLATGSGAVWVDGAASVARTEISVFEASGAVWVGGAADTEKSGVSSNVWEYDEQGEIVIDGEAISAVNRNQWMYAEQGAVIVDGEALSDRSALHFYGAEDGSVIVAGEQVSESLCDVANRVTQVVAEVLLLNKSSAFATQVVAEVLIGQPKVGDFWPVLSKMIAAQQARI